MGRVLCLVLVMLRSSGKSLVPCSGHVEKCSGESFALFVVMLRSIGESLVPCSGHVEK